MLKQDPIQPDRQISNEIIQPKTQPQDSKQLQVQNHLKLQSQHSLVTKVKIKIKKFHQNRKKDQVTVFNNSYLMIRSVQVVRMRSTAEKIFQIIIQKIIKITLIGLPIIQDFLMISSPRTIKAIQQLGLSEKDIKIPKKEDLKKLKCPAKYSNDKKLWKELLQEDQLNRKSELVSRIVNLRNDLIKRTRRKNDGDKMFGDHYEQRSKVEQQKFIQKSTKQISQMKRKQKNEIRNVQIQQETKDRIIQKTKAKEERLKQQKQQQAEQLKLKKEKNRQHDELINQKMHENKLEQQEIQESINQKYEETQRRIKLILKQKDIDLKLKKQDRKKQEDSKIDKLYKTYQELIKKRDKIQKKSGMNKVEKKIEKPKIWDQNTVKDEEINTFTQRQIKIFEKIGKCKSDTLRYEVSHKLNVNQIKRSQLQEYNRQVTQQKIQKLKQKTHKFQSQQKQRKHNLTKKISDFQERCQRQKHFEMFDLQTRYEKQVKLKNANQQVKSFICIQIVQSRSLQDEQLQSFQDHTMQTIKSRSYKAIYNRKKISLESTKKRIQRSLNKRNQLENIGRLKRAQSYSKRQQEQRIQEYSERLKKRMEEQQKLDKQKQKQNEKLTTQKSRILQRFDTMQLNREKKMYKKMLKDAKSKKKIRPRKYHTTRESKDQSISSHIQTLRPNLRNKFSKELLRQRSKVSHWAYNLRSSEKNISFNKKLKKIVRSDHPFSRSTSNLHIQSIESLQRQPNKGHRKTLTDQYYDTMRVTQLGKPNMKFIKKINPMEDQIIPSSQKGFVKPQYLKEFKLNLEIEMSEFQTKLITQFKEYNKTTDETKLKILKQKTKNSLLNLLRQNKYFICQLNREKDENLQRIKLRTNHLEIFKRNVCECKLEYTKKNKQTTQIYWKTNDDIYTEIG